MIQLNNDWDNLLEDAFQTDRFLKLWAFLNEEYDQQVIYPAMHDIFNALRYTPYGSVRVVILGQDPYHGPGQAQGLSFSVQPDVSVPPSLQNIFRELRDDLGCPLPPDGHLKPWADRGVLLLNTVLTVRAGQAGSHRNQGWEPFTDRIITLLGQHPRPLVFMLWGRHAQSKVPLIPGDRHLILKAPHPSPLSAHRGFLGSRPFSRANRFLMNSGQSPIDWCLS